MPATEESGLTGPDRPAARTLLTATTRTTVVLVVAVLCLAGYAYHYTLSTWLAGLALDSPLAYLGLVPLVALALAVVALRRSGDDHEIHDRQVDLLVGVPLLAGALLVVLVLPRRMDSEFWVLRLEVLTLPVFVAGVVALLLGTRAVWRLRAPLAFLLLAWPVPWTALLERLDGPLLATTGAGVRAVTSVVPLAREYGGSDDLMFEVVTGGGSFVVTVASACAGASSTLGFLLLGSAAMLVTRGPRSHKALWLATGLVVSWSANLLRVLVLLGAGRLGGKHLALDVLHPVLGTVLFALTSVVMLLLLPRFGLSLGGSTRQRRPRAARVGLLAGGRWSRAGIATLLVASTAAAGVANGDLARHDRILGPLGEARLAAFASSPVRLTGWQIGDAGTYAQAARYFGTGATWHRLLYHSAQTPPGSQLTGLPVSVDAIGTRSRSALKAFSVEACYAFHRFDVSSHSQVDLGAGMRGEVFTYYNKRDRRHWTTLAWEWPVRDGATAGYERVVLILVDVEGVPVPAVTGVPRPASSFATTAHRLAAERDFLRAFARMLVTGVLTNAAPEGTVA